MEVGTAVITAAVAAITVAAVGGVKLLYVLLAQRLVQ